MEMTLRLSFVLAILFCGIEISFAQQATFELEPAKVGEKFDENIADVLRASYGQVLASDSDAPDFRWSVVGGVLPEGLRLLSNGRVVGTPQQARKQPYVFRASVVDEATADVKPLIVTLSLQVNGGPKKTSGVRLQSANELAPPDEEQPEEGGGVLKPKAQAPKAAVTISGADQLPSGEFKAQLAYTKKDPKVAYLLVIENRTNLLRRIDEIAAKNTVSDAIELENGKSTIRVWFSMLQTTKSGRTLRKI